MTDTWGEAARKAAQYHKQADRKPTMKIDDETYARAISLVIDMAAAHDGILNGLTTAGFYQTASDIAASLPKPVDPEKEAVCITLEEVGCEYTAKLARKEDFRWDKKGELAHVALAIFRAGRAFERENGNG